MRRARRSTAVYVALLGVCLLLAVITGWTRPAGQIDGNAYDWMLSLHAPKAWEPHSALLAIDEASLARTRGRRDLRHALGDALDIVARAAPRVVAIDIILSDEGGSIEDRRLEAALEKTPGLVLASDLAGASWEDPLPRFRKHADAVGHVHADPDPVSRHIPLEKASTGRERRWAVGLEAFRLFEALGPVTESPDELELAGIRIPASRKESRALRIRYLPAPIPRVGLSELLDRPERSERFRGRAVFVGVTAQSDTRDRLMTPFGTMMSGVEFHAHLFETLLGRRFLRGVPDSLTLLLGVAVVAAAGIIFAFWFGWRAYLAGAVLLALAHTMPHLAFVNGWVLSYYAPVSAAWLGVVAAASFQHFVIRGQLFRSETEKTRYQQAIRFVTHEMRTPLTAIQGSSELMGRYNLSDEKRKQMAGMIHSESKRLARMIQTFLDVERLSEGQMELNRQAIPVEDVVEACVERARVLADNKGIVIRKEAMPGYIIDGDRELMEYAIYNLLTNAVKYSPSDTTVLVTGAGAGAELQLSVRDEGIGMDEKELKNIFRKFYRTKKAEASGEPGTGIGLSIVEQIVAGHGGRIEVDSAPGRGSCFTMVLPARPEPRRVSHETSA